KRWAERSMQTAERIGNNAALRSAAALALAARAELGETADSARYMDQIEQGFTMRGDMAWKSSVAVDAFLAFGEVERARRFAEIAHAHAGGRLREAWSAAALGRVTLRSGPAHWDEAARWYARATELAEVLGLRS